MAKGTNLVIVESPSKAKTIGKYLGSEYQVMACMGHLRDLPKSTMGVDIEADFAPQYIPMKGKEALIRELKTAATKADRVYLATDPDREGEAISWHLKELFALGDEKAKRVTFNEITKKVVLSSIDNPRDIDYNLVDAQQARRILDRIVGYQLSPLLWKKVRRGLSAGRVQSVATRLVVEREREISAFVPKEYWTLDAHLRILGKDGGFTARYYGDGKKRELTSESEVDEIIRDIEGQDFNISSIKRTDKRRSPTPPFITSTLQQEASRKLNMTPRRTMAVAQQLYEGVEITGEGSVGLITYMRTDSLRLSDEALQAAKDFIIHRYGQSFYAGAPRRFRKKDGAQDAHEAIRPSDVNLDPERIKNDLTKEQYRLYKLIWSRFVACQMAEAVYDSVQIDTTCAGHVFRAGEQIMKFPGFTAVYEEGRDDDEEEKSGMLPALDGTEKLRSQKNSKEQHFTAPPARYTEATLVKAMEERGVGRPSTYAAIVATIQDRDYVIKKDKRLHPTPLGEVVTDLMLDRFNDIIDVEFTANMERRLDEVEAGNIRWKQILRDFYAGFHASMLSAEEALEGKRIKVPEEVSQEICDVCGKNMVVKFGRFGPFLACPGYPQCSNTKPIVERMPGRCPKCSSTILKRKSKRGYVFYACERGAECGFMTWDVPTEADCPVCGKTMFKRSGKGAMKPFCTNEECSNFLPEDKRGYKRRMPKATAETVENAQEIPETGTKKTGAKKGTKKK